MAVIDSYSETNQDATESFTTAPNGWAQSFTGDGSTLGSVKIYMKKTGSPGFNPTVNIYAHSGTFGTSSVPTGAALATSDSVTEASISTSLSLITFTFSGANQITLTNGTKYCVGATVWDTGSGANCYAIGKDTSSPSHSGNYATIDVFWSADSTTDMPFYVLSNSNAKLDTLHDDFDDNSTNSTLWGGAYSSSATYAETGGQLEITLSSGGVNYAGYVSTDVYDLTESSIYVKVPTMCNTATTAEAIFTLHNSANTNKVEIMQEQGTLYFRHVISGSATNLASVTYNGSTHLWWRISETGGTVYWDTSTDGSSWTNRYSESTPIDITALKVELSAGTYAVVASPGTVEFDNFNIFDPVIGWIRA